MVPDRGLSTSQEHGVKGKKTRLTYAFTTNADGSEKLPAFIIGKAHKPRPFKNKTGPQLGFYYRNNAKAWMTAVLYQEWLSSWDNELRLQRRHIVLLQDNFKGHIPPKDLTNIRVENFEPNLTPHVQPADAGIIRCFKAHYRRRYIHRAINRYDKGTTPAKIYEINQLEAMRLAATAWDDVSAETIANCWRKTDLLPPSLLQPAPSASTSTEAAITAAEQAVVAELDKLQDKGVLHRSNRLDLEEFVEPVDERQGLGDGDTEEDIYEAVMKASAAREMMEVNGGDDDDDVEVEPLPSLREVLQAASTVQRLTETLNEPFARQLEALLNKLGHYARLEHSKTLHDAPLTDFFTCS
jgi:hypothetical protein